MSDDAQPILFCIPIFNDWETARLLLVDLDRICRARHLLARVMFVDDGSTDAVLTDIEPVSEWIAGVEILTLRRNVGHQRAIALGLTFAYIERRFDAVVVMDGDGEDAPADAVRLIDHWHSTGRPDAVVFAKRGRRSESLTFRLFYRTFKIMHLILTGNHVEVGNFSLVPKAALARLVVSSEIWNHYSAGVFKLRLPTDQIPIPRARRLAGKSSMNFSALVVHGLSAISVYGERVGVRLLVTNLVVIGALVGVVGLLALLRAIAHVAVPGEVFLAAAVAVSCLVAGLFVTLGCLFTILHGRAAATFLPVRDYRHYVVRSSMVGTAGQHCPGIQTSAVAAGDTT